jgi:hypothetical protein
MLGFFRALKKDKTIHPSPGDSRHPLIWPETLNHSCQSNPHFPTCMQNNQMFAFAQKLLSNVSMSLDLMFHVKKSIFFVF